MSNVIQFPSPVSTQCSASTMPGLTTPELRRRALDNFYTAERRAGCDAVTAYDRMCAYSDDLDRIASIMGASK